MCRQCRRLTHRSLLQHVGHGLTHRSLLQHVGQHILESQVCRRWCEVRLRHEDVRQVCWRVVGHVVQHAELPKRRLLRNYRRRCWSWWLSWWRWTSRSQGVPDHLGPHTQHVAWMIFCAQAAIVLDSCWWSRRRWLSWKRWLIPQVVAHAHRLNIAPRPITNT